MKELAGCAVWRAYVYVKGEERAESTEGPREGEGSQPSFSGLKGKMVAGQRGALLPSPVASGRDCLQLPSIPVPDDLLSGGNGREGEAI